MLCTAQVFFVWSKSSPGMQTVLFSRWLVMCLKCSIIGTKLVSSSNYSPEIEGKKMQIFPSEQPRNKGHYHKYPTPPRKKNCSVQLEMVTDPKSWTGGQNESKMHFLTEKWTFFCLSMFFKEVLHNHFNIYVNILSLTCPVTSPIPEVVSQNFTNKSCLVCVKSDK